ncbi:ubiquinone biosynthesis protein COQ9 [Ascodesmis nigricans]|uniref:Ubiquinone biosynthesis protein n=1 Tax=Ascodesmis nigricans TaxID=341454 RepID=A0A4S2N115_9PEZI|nr:ubiquinone biosynthesis protein COQ9 [Ascodesmis nigricans]
MLLRPLLQQPRTLTLAASRSTATQLLQRSYHSAEYGTPGHSYSPTETAILSAALHHVPTTGFTKTSLTTGLRELGYPDITLNLFPRGEFDLVKFYLEKQRLNLGALVDFPKIQAEAGLGRLSMTQKIRTLCIERLKANEPVIHKLPEALGLMSLLENIPASVTELAELSDEIWALAGDTSVDTSWYTKRASLGAVYASTELFMTQDRSADFAETWKFLDRRLEDVQSLGKATANIGHYVGFTGNAVLNILRSKNVRLF